MKNLSRRCFIKSTFYSVGCLVTGVKPVFASVSPENNPEKTKLLLSWQKKAREAFHKQEYGKSIGFYKKLINKAPGEIAYYDGMKKSLEKLGKHEEIVAYYKYGIERNPQRVEFLNRLAKYYRETFAGNKKLAAGFEKAEEEDSLLQSSIRLSRMAIERDSRKRFLYFELLEALYVKYLLEVQTKSPLLRGDDLTKGEEDTLVRLVTPYIPDWMAIKFPGRRTRSLPVLPYTDEEMLVRIDQKRRRVLYIESEIEQRARDLADIRKKYQARICERCVINKEHENAYTGASEILTINPEETNLLGVVKKQWQKEERYDLIINLYKELRPHRNGFWTTAGLAKASRLQGGIQETELLYHSLKLVAGTLNGKKTGIIWGGLAQCALQEHRYEDARRIILEAMEFIKGVTGASLFLFFLYAKSYAMQNRPEEAVEILHKIADPLWVTDHTDMIYRYIAPDAETDPDLYCLHVSFKANVPVSIEEKIKVWCEIAKVHLEGGNREGVLQALTEIDNLWPSHPFVVRVGSLVGR